MATPVSPLAPFVPLVPLVPFAPAAPVAPAGPAGPSLLQEYMKATAIHTAKKRRRGFLLIL
ncbi:hypothetical protein F3J22_24110 [Chitinophaga sp. Cy-1792]|nr:hypothetical protein [Chitinophaga sp. Cy-1792]